MKAKPAKSPMDLGIQSIEPVRLEDPQVRGVLMQTRRSLNNPQLHDILCVRTAIQQYLCTELIKCGYVHPPVYMLAGCTDPLNHWTYPARVNYYGTETSVTQSLILQKILMVMLSPVERVFWASPNIRMEMQKGQKGYKYATEFMQVDFERRGGTYEQMLGIISDLVRGLYQHLNEKHADIIERLRGKLLPLLDEPLPVIDAARYSAEHSLIDHDDLESHISVQTQGKPFIIVNMNREAYDCYDSESGRFLNYDVIVPPQGNNPHPVECLSGAERTRSLADLKRRMTELGYPLDYFAPFFELYDSLCQGNESISCAGAGFGVERLTYSILGLADLHEVYPFPRPVETRIAL